MKKIILTLIVLGVLGAATYAYYKNKGQVEPTVTTLQITRGDIADTVQATGTLQALRQVNVGTQVSGVVQNLYVDFNHIVKAGQVIARLDPSIIQTQIEQREASVTRAEADLERLRVGLADAKRKLEQARGLWEKQLIPRDQLDTAELNVKTQESQIKSSEAGLVQAKADLNAQRVNLGHTVITAPIDGIIMQRSVDEGQTVQSSTTAPTLYIIATDLSEMQVLASIDESEVGRMRPGQPVTFRVDAYPNDTFRGAVKEVRLQPTTVQNVVTYSTVITVPNPEYKLKPGMTANASPTSCGPRRRRCATVRRTMSSRRSSRRFRPNCSAGWAAPEVAVRAAEWAAAPAVRLMGMLLLRRQRTRRPPRQAPRRQVHPRGGAIVAVTVPPAPGRAKGARAAAAISRT
jgi:HlyD family secretion protein